MLWAIVAAVVVGLVLVYGFKDLLFLLGGLGVMLDELWKKRSAIEKVVIGIGAIFVWPVGLIGVVLWLMGQSVLRQVEREINQKYPQPSPQPKIANDVKAPSPNPPGEGGSQGMEGKADE